MLNKTCVGTTLEGQRIIGCQREFAHDIEFKAPGLCFSCFYNKDDKIIQSKNKHKKTKSNIKKHPDKRTSLPGSKYPHKLVARIKLLKDRGVIKNVGDVRRFFNIERRAAWELFHGKFKYVPSFNEMDMRRKQRQLDALLKRTADGDNTGG